MQVVTTVRELDAFVGGVFVPTMGALHAGHASLVEQAAAMTGARPSGTGTEQVATGLAKRPVVVSIFVNRTQFNDPADYQRYPKTLDADLEICRRAGASAVFVPEHEVVYPADAPVPVPPLPRQASEPQLEDAFRPGHFAGVCQVVARLFELVRPAACILGEKDWQQLRVLDAMTTSMRLPIQIVPGRTVREHDGLAMSSRNRFLSPSERATAPVVYRALCEAAAERDWRRAEARMAEVLRAAGLEVQYAAVREASGLGPAEAGRPGRSLIACKLGSIRLIDNAAWG